MTISGPTNLPAFFNSDADFQAWVQGIHNALIAIGLTQTADTGQINPATVTKPTAGSQSKGYEIWRFADTLQSSVPVFFKLEYGSGNSNLNQPGMWITVGSGSDGAGNLTGQLTSRDSIAPSGSKTAGTVLPTYVSGDSGSVSVACNVDTGSNSFGFAFHIMRPRDNSGAVTNEGVIHMRWNNNSNQMHIQFIPATGAVPGDQINVFPAVSPWFFNHGASGSNADACPVLCPLFGAWRYLKFLMTGGADFGTGGTFPCTLFGASHTFLALNGSCGSLNLGGNGNGGNPGFAMPWE